MSTLTFYTLYFAIFNTLQVALCMQDFNLFWYCGIATFIYMIDLYLFKRCFRNTIIAITPFSMSNH